MRLAVRIDGLRARIGSRQKERLAAAAVAAADHALRSGVRPVPPQGGPQTARPADALDDRSADNGER